MFDLFPPIDLGMVVTINASPGCEAKFLMKGHSSGGELSIQTNKQNQTKMLSLKKTYFQNGVFGTHNQNVDTTDAFLKELLGYNHKC